jgi:transposase-like protein
MKIISKETKEAIVKKILGKKDVNLKMIAKQNNIVYSTLTRWIREYQSGQLNESTIHHSSKMSLSRKEKLAHILATASLDEQALGVYCRERGLYAIQLTEWKNEMTKDNHEQKNESLLAELKTLRCENKQLKQEINRKDRALAETTALLVLKKKANAIWGESEDV